MHGGAVSASSSSVEHLETSRLLDEYRAAAELTESRLKEMRDAQRAMESEIVALTQDLSSQSRVIRELRDQNRAASILPSGTPEICSSAGAPHDADADAQPQRSASSEPGQGPRST